MPSCASHRYHSTQAAADICIKHISNHFDELSTISRVEVRIPGMRRMVRVEIPVPPGRSRSVGHELRHAASGQRPVARPLPLAQAQDSVLGSERQESDGTQEQQEDDAAESHDGIQDLNDEEDTGSAFPSRQPSLSTRRARSTVDNWIDHLQDPPPSAFDSAQSQHRALSSFGPPDNGHTNDSMNDSSLTPEVQARRMARRQWYRDPVIYFLLVLGIAFGTAFVLLSCIWSFWRYLINPAGFENMEVMRRQVFEPL